MFKILLPLILFLSSCATLTGPSIQDVKITTTPPGAEIFVDGRSYETPAIVSLKGKDSYNVTASKNGYKDSYGIIRGEPRIMAGIVGNVFNFTGIIGMAIDYVGGSFYKMDKNLKIKMRKARR